MQQIVKTDKIKKLFSNENLIRILFCYRILMVFIMNFFIKFFTNRGDTFKYLFANPLDVFKTYGFPLFLDDTYPVMFFIGAVHTLLRYEMLTHIVFSLLAFYGIKRFLDAVPEKNNKYYKILILMMFSPSFTLWTSVAGKETLIVFAMGIFSAEVVRFFSKEKFRISFLLIIALYLICRVKEQYIPAITLLIVYMKLRERIKLSWKADFFILIAIFAANCFFIYFMRDTFAAYSLKVHNFFRVEARSTRERVFIEQYDFFKKMPYLLPLALWGPTWSETKISVLHLAVFLENFLFLGVYIYLIKDSFIKIFKKFNIYYQWVFLSVMALGWLFIAHYIQGTMNPGSAIRYRTNLYLLVTALCFSVTCIKEKVFSEYNNEKNSENTAVGNNLNESEK